MASTLEEELSCPICRDVFRDPVLLSCSHSFCRLCLRSWWTEGKPTKECPICNKRSSRSDPPSNLVLKNLCEAFVRERSEDSDVCSVHSEKLKLFCLDHQQPVCVVCRDSKAHSDHSFCPLEEAAQDLREELNKSLQPLKENLSTAKGLKGEYDILLLIYIRKQFYETKKQIQDEFKKLHQFLLEEEEARMKALREEEEQKTQRVKDKVAAVSNEIEALSETIRATEEQLRSTDISFLLGYKAAVDRVQHCPLLEEQPPCPENLINRAKHLGNLAFSIWTNMKRLVQYTPVILDPNTVNNASVSKDLTSFRLGEGQRLTKKPETTVWYGALALGSEGFDSGSHSWDVDVGDNEVWGVGVQTDTWEEGVKKEEAIETWAVALKNGEYNRIFSHRGFGSLQLDSNPRRIKVCLDCDKQEVTFHDSDTNTHIHSFTQISQKKLFPSFFIGGKGRMRILPQDSGFEKS